MVSTIVLGLDGATWDMLEPLLDDGELPNLQRVRSAGCDGTIESTFPPITAPAWLSMATGQNPGKTGVFNFLNRDSPDSFEFEPLGSDKFKDASFWDILSAQGQSVGIFNYPMLYPPYELQGFMVSGLGSAADEQITYPKSLGRELDDVTGGYEVKVPYADPKYQGRPDDLLDDLLDIIGKRERAIEFLLSEKDVDHFFGIISATDWAQHYFWRFCDENHVLYDPASGHQDALRTIWKRVDETIGVVADHASQEDAHLLLVSDHGFGPVNRTFHSNEWLQQAGFAIPAERSLLDKLRTSYFPYLRRIGEAVVGVVPQLNDAAKSVGESIRKSPGDWIDFGESVAFAPRQNLTCGMVYMLSETPADKRAVAEELEELVEESTGPTSIDIYEPDEIYHGPEIDLAPDLLFEIDDFQCAVDPRPATETSLFSEGPPSESRNGGHNRDGIFLAFGPETGDVEDMQVSIYDIAPTLLHLHDVPVPEEMDGNVLTKTFDSESMTVDQVTTERLSDLTDASRTAKRDDTEAVKERLDDLGYI